LTGPLTRQYLFEPQLAGNYNFSTV